MTRVGRAVEKGETKSFIKVVVDRNSDAILGAAILGVGGDEAIQAAIEAMAAGVTAAAYTRVMAIHPAVAVLAGSGHIASPAAVHELSKRNFHDRASPDREDGGS